MHPQSLTWNDPHPEVGDEEIHSVEAELGIAFPLDFVGCAKVFHGASVEESDFTYQDPVLGEAESCLGQLLSFDSGRPDYILGAVKELSGVIPAGLVPVAEDGGGDYICFDYRGDPEQPTVVYWVHELAGDESVVRLTDTFSEFLDLLRRPKAD